MKRSLEAWVVLLLFTSRLLAQNKDTVTNTPDKTRILSGVTVVAQKNEAQIGFNKKKFAVDQSLVSKGGAAADLLQNIPSVQINGNGDISIRGSSGVNVLIDGKPSLIAGGNIAQLLQSIPASSIESIEVITNPSARYDAEGQAGIINIILIKNKKSGFNGSAAATAGVQHNYNGSANIGFQNSRLNLYASYGYRYGTRLSNGYQYLTYLHANDPVVFSNETFPSTTVDKGSNLKAGMDYYLNEKNVLSVSGSFNNATNNRKEFLSIDELSASHAIIEQSHRTNLTNGKGNSYDINLDFSKTFNKPKEELTVSLGFSQGANHNLQSYTTDVYNINGEVVKTMPAILQNNNSEHNRFYNAQLNYILPVGKTGELDAGYRSQIRWSDRVQDAYNFNNATGLYDKYDGVSNTFKSNNQVHALYLNYQNQVGNFSYQVGVRAEDALLSATLMGYDTGHVLYYTPFRVTNFRLYPSIFLTQKTGAEQQLQFSYSRRVARPTPRQLNPVLDVSDPVNYDAGNPALLPEDIHFFELGYQQYWKVITLTASLYYRQTNDFIKRIEGPPVKGIITTTSQNLAHSCTGGLELISKVNVMKAWNFLVNANVYHNKTAAAPAYGLSASEGFSWNANITHNIIINDHFSLQLRGDYRAADVVAQDRNHAAYGVDAGVKFDFLNKRATINFSGRDIFNSRKWSFLRESNAVLLDFERHTESARANIAFTYRFGKSSLAVKKIKHNDEQPEI